MELELFAAGYAVDNGKVGQRAGCAVVLIARDGDADRRREISHQLDSATTPQSELQAAYMALEAVRPAHRQDAIKLTAGPYPIRMLQKRDDGYVNTPRSNERLVQRLRTLAGQFGRLTTAHGKCADFFRAGELAQVAARDQTQYDSGTQDWRSD